MTRRIEKLKQHAIRKRSRQVFLVVVEFCVEARLSSASDSCDNINLQLACVILLLLHGNRILIEMRITGIIEVPQENGLAMQR